MKAFLLAAGLGQRLRPITLHIPKCLVPINGKPLLDYWLRLLTKHNVEEVLINLHYISEKVLDFISKQPYPLKIKTYYEKELLGSAGTLNKNRAWVKHQESFFIFYADNLTNIDLNKMLNYHRKYNPILTMGLFRTKNPKECGIAQLNENDWIVDFKEKPNQPASNLANAGIYIVSPDIFNYIDDRNTQQDIGFDVLPKLIGKMKGYIIDEYILDIGTPKQYQQAQQDIKTLYF